MSERKRIRDYGISLGELSTGPRNQITDVPGVLVGHQTIHRGGNHTGVTVILPGSDNSFLRKYTAACYVHNGYGKSTGLLQVEELGVLETPIALTNTLNVGLVWDGLLDYVLKRCRQDGVEVYSVNPVVGECNDSRINEIQNRAVTAQDVQAAIRQAGVDFEEGAVGAGTGILCYGFKGGIGSASRVLPIDGRTYTIGALVQSNFGAMKDFTLNGTPLGQKALAWRARQGQPVEVQKDRGSIISVIATDLPVSARQLKRMIRRAGVGIARTGSYTGHGSGEVMLGFTTANRIPAKGPDILPQQILREELLDGTFRAVAEAVNEAILNSLVCAPETAGLRGERYPSLADFLNEI